MQFASAEMTVFAELDAAAEYDLRCAFFEAFIFLFLLTPFFILSSHHCFVPSAPSCIKHSPLYLLRRLSVVSSSRLCGSKPAIQAQRRL